VSPADIRQAVADKQAVSVPKGASIWPVINSFVEDYNDGYEFRGDDGDYMPNETERFWIKDCVAGLLDELSQKGLMGTPTKADEWNRVVKSLVEKAEDADITVELTFDDGQRCDYFNQDISERVAGWENQSACEDLLAAISQDAASVGADRTRVLIPEDVTMVSDVAVTRTEIGEEPDFVMAADLTSDYRGQ
jgi:hypothetical protein